MKIIQILILVSCPFLFLNAQNIEWIRIIENDVNNWITSPTSNLDKIYFGGLYHGNLSFDEDFLNSTGGADGYISSINPEGDFVQTISWGSQFFEYTKEVEFQDNAIYVVGNSTSPTYELLGNTYQNPNTSSHIFLAKIDTSLSEVIWLESGFSQASSNYNSSLSSYNELINISGFYGSFQTFTFNSLGEMLWNKEFTTTNSIRSKIHQEKVYTVIDSFNVENQGGNPVGGIYKYKLIEYNDIGEQQKAIDIFEFDSPQLGNGGGIYEIEVDDNNNVYLTGSFEVPIHFNGQMIDPLGENKGLIIKLDSSLAPLWLRVVDNYSYEITPHDDNYWITWQNSVGADSSTFFVEKYNLDDSLEASYQFPSIIGDLVFVESDIYFVGTLKGTLNIDNQTFINEGFPDFLIMKFNESGTTSIETDPVSNQQISIFPNPAIDEVSIKSSLPVHHIQIFDFLGKLIFQISNLNVQDYQIDVSNLRSGQYHLRLNNSFGYNIIISR